MPIIITMISILLLTGLALAWNYIFKFKICPICAGVAGTWLWMFAGYVYGYGADQFILPTLMGGSVVGIAYKLSSRVPERLDLAWKTTFIPLGFAAVYEALNFNFTYSAAILAALLAISWFFFFQNNSEGKSVEVEKIKQDLDKCC